MVYTIKRWPGSCQSRCVCHAGTVLHTQLIWVEDAHQDAHMETDKMQTRTWRRSFMSCLVILRIIQSSLRFSLGDCGSWMLGNVVSRYLLIIFINNYSPGVIITCYPLGELAVYSIRRPDEFCAIDALILFCLQDELFLLVTDQGFLTESQVVWETLSNVEGDCHFVDTDFHTYRKSEPVITPISAPQVAAGTDEQIDQEWVLVPFCLNIKMSLNSPYIQWSPRGFFDIVTQT